MIDHGSGDPPEGTGDDWYARFAEVTALLGEQTFVGDDGDGLIEATVDGNGRPVSLILTNRAVRLLSEAALGARIVAALDRARERADAVAGALLADRLGILQSVAGRPGGGRAGVPESELAAVETARDTTGTVAVTVNALGEVYDVRLARAVLELDRTRLAGRIAEAERTAYHAALRCWADSHPYRAGLRRSG